VTPAARRPFRIAAFLRGAPLVLLFAAFLAGSAGGQETVEVALAFVGPADGSARRGALQGLEEARLQGEFLGQRYRLDATPDAAAAVVAALPAAELARLAGQHPTVPVLNVAAADDALRDHCLPNLFHVGPSARMLADAVAQWRKLEPDSPAAARAWHPAFEKYAAAQLNKRYTERFGEPMDDLAWAGWAAVKLLSDTVAREQTAAPAALLDALRSRLAFDGQKGADLSFRSDGQLRQPLLLVVQDRIVGEAPVRGVADIEDLDSLGPARCPAPATP
jgi:hypothetical protein